MRAVIRPLATQGLEFGGPAGVARVYFF